jgi:hypothetical protein
MKKFRLAAASAALAAGLAFAAGPIYGQMDASAPIVVKQSAPKPPAKVWLKAEVVHADSHSIMVREQGNEMKVHTFTYARTLQPQMQKIITQGGYQHGDKVKIQYVEGETVALAIHGKPSKPQRL